MDSEREYLCLESCVRGHHIYKKRWTPLVGERLRTRKEDGNCHDRFAVAVFKADKSTVGHIPREFSRIACYFLTHGGEITCEVTGRRRRSVAPGKGLEVPCTYTFLGKPKIIKKVVKLIDLKKQSSI